MLAGDSAIALATIRRSLKYTYFQALSAAGLGRALKRGYARKDVPIILNFHRVSPEPNPYWPPLMPEAFDTLVARLVSECEVITLDQLSHNNDAARPRVILSFDDGSQDFVEYVAPILHRYEVSANFNVIVQSVETGKPPWIIRVVDALNAASTARVQRLEVPGLSLRLRGDDAVSKVRFGTALTGYLKALTPADRDRAAGDVEALIAETDSARFTPMMTRAEVKAMSELHELGAHSYSHEPFAQLSDEQVEDELSRSAAFFTELGCPMRIFAFPYGSFRADQIGALRARGVEHILLVEARIAQERGVYTRITMYGDSDAELWLRAMGHRADWARAVRARFQSPR